MSAVIVGSPSLGSKILRRADFATERNGLETLNEIYTIRTADRKTLQPSFGALHSAYSSAPTKFARMTVENFSFREQNGDLTELNVTYVGLTTSTGLPPALVRLIPTPGAGIFGPPLVIEAEFITDINESQFIKGNINATAQIKLGNIVFGQVNQMPELINGTLMPSNPIAPYAGKQQGPNLLNYFGYCTESHACERRGLFLVARTIYKEYQANFLFKQGPFSK